MADEHRGEIPAVEAANALLTVWQTAIPAPTFKSKTAALPLQTQLSYERHLQQLLSSPS